MENFGINWKKWLIVIPARLESTRLFEKPLQLLGRNNPLIIQTYSNIKKLQDHGASVYIATDSKKISDVCNKYQVPVKITDSAHNSGTDRVHEVAMATDHSFVLNLQGDEPFVSINDLVNLCRSLESTHADLSTLVFRSTDQDSFLNPNTVKAVRNLSGRAMYFSRHAIPYGREQNAQLSFWHHMGVYAFTRQSLDKFCTLPASDLEKTEKLEQLRALENGLSIHLEPANYLSKGVDTPQDLEEARKYLQQKSDGTL